MAAGTQAPAAIERNTDVREFTLGMSVDELPTHRYVDFACGADGGPAIKPISDWSEFTECPRDAAGLREVAFRYDDFGETNRAFRGTRIAGHPVILSLLLDDDGIVNGIRAVTDPKARDYHRKKAYLLHLRVKGRYGEEGWTCTSQEPKPGQRPVGGQFINERCEKVFDGRKLIVHTHLYREPGMTEAEYVNKSRFEIFYPATS